MNWEKAEKKHYEEHGHEVKTKKLRAGGQTVHKWEDGVRWIQAESVVFTRNWA